MPCRYSNAKILRLSDSQVLGMVPMDLCLSSGMGPVADRRETGRMFLHYEFYLDPGAKVLWDQASFAGVMGFRVFSSQPCDDTTGRCNVLYSKICTKMNKTGVKHHGLDITLT